MADRPTYEELEERLGELERQTCDYGEIKQEWLKLNQDVKSNAVGRVRARNQQELVKNVRGFLRSRQRQPRIVQKYFQEQHVRYAAI